MKQRIYREAMGFYTAQQGVQAL